MNKELSWIWSSKNSSICYSLIFIVFLLTFIIGMEYPMPIGLFLSGIMIILIFFKGLEYYPIRFYFLDDKTLFFNLFWLSLVFRVIFLLYMYLLTYYNDPDNLPMVIGAADSWTYHLMGKGVAQSESIDEVVNVLSYYVKTRADWGFAIYTGFVYKLFGIYPVMIKIINAFLGSFTVIHLSKIAYMIFDRKTAILTGVIAMMIPTALWFGSMNLKETLMIFITSYVFYHLLVMLHKKKINIIKLILIIILSFSLFYIRTVLAVLMIGSVSLYLVVIMSSKKMNKGITLLLLIVIFSSMIFLIYKYNFNQRISEYYAARTTQFDRELTASSKARGISYDRALIAPLMMISAPITPFPSLLFLEERQFKILAHYQNEFIRNVLFFFAFVAIYLAIKHREKEAWLILFFVAGYEIVLTLSGISFQDRYQFPALPYFIIFIAKGLTKVNHKLKNYWLIYLFFIGIAIILWNYFKMANRGLI